MICYKENPKFTELETIMSTYYHVKFQHTEETVRKLSMTQYISFQKSSVLIQILVGLLLIYVGAAWMQDETSAVMMYFFGGWILLGWKQLPRHRADKILRSCGGTMPETEFFFDDKCLRVENGDAQSELEYDKIIRLSYDEAYDYLFVSRVGAYMIPRQEKEQKEKAFREFVAKRVGLEWVPVRNVFSLSVKAIRTERQNTRK